MTCKEFIVLTKRIPASVFWVRSFTVPFMGKYLYFYYKIFVSRDLPVLPRCQLYFETETVYKEVTELVVFIVLFLNNFIDLIFSFIFLPVDLSPDLLFKPRVQHDCIDPLEDSTLWLLRQQSLKGSSRSVNWKVSPPY